MAALEVLHSTWNSSNGLGMCRIGFSVKHLLSSWNASSHGGDQSNGRD